MELAQLVFDVQTQKLLDAKKAIDELAKSMGNLNKVSADETKSAINSAKAKEAEAKAAVAAAKAKEAEAKAALAAAKVNESNVKTKIAEENAAKKVVEQLAKKAAAEEKARVAAERAAEAESKRITVLERQQSILDYMTQGFSKGQATVLSYAKAAGALTDELEQLGGVLQTQRKLMGSDPFDKSMSGLVALKNQYGEIREAIRQYNSDMDLTRNQTRDLARDKERIIEKMKLEGASFTDIKNAIREYNQVYTEQASKVNSLIKVEKDRERASKDHANAVRNVQAAEERLFATVSHINDGMAQNATLNERAALAIGSYERNLRLAGITGEQAAAKLQKFKAAQAQITAAENKRMQDYVARGVGVQMGDVGVSLASGMNPFLVMIQQGDQLRGLIQQAGRDGLDLRNVMNDAARQIAVSFKDVGIAVGSFVGGAFKSLGNGLYVILDNLIDTQRMALSVGNALSLLGVDPIDALDIVASSLGMIRTALTLLGATAVVTIATVTVAAYQGMKATDELTKSVARFGAQQGLSFDQAKIAATELAETTNSTITSTMEIVGEFTKSGITDMGLYSDALTTATKLQKTFGTAASDTVKAYKDLQDKPYENLLKIAKETGNVTIETLKQVKALEAQGESLEAAKVATQAYSNAMTMTARDADTNLSSMTRLWRTIKEEVAGAYNEIERLANSENWKYIESSIIGLSYLAKQLSLSFEGVSKASKFDFDGVKDVNLEMLKNTEAYSKKIKDVWSDTANTISASIRQANAQAAISFDKLSGVMEGFKSKLDPKTMSKSAFIAAGIDDASKKAGQAIVGENFKVAKEFLTKQWEDSQKATTNASSGVDKYTSDLKQLNDLLINTGVSTEGWTKSQVAINKIIESEYWSTYSAKQKELLLTTYGQILASEELAKKLKDEAKAYDELFKRVEDSDNAWFAINQELDVSNKSLALNLKQLQQQGSLIGLSEEQARELNMEYERQNKLQEISIKYSKEEVEIRNKLRDLQAGDPRLEEELAQLRANRALEEQAVNQMIANKAAEDYFKSFKEIRDDLSDTLYTALTEGGKSASKKLRSLIEAQLKKKFIMPAIDVVVNLAMNTVGGGLLSLLGLATGGSSSSSGVSAGGILSGASNLKSAYTAYNAIGNINSFGWGNAASAFAGAPATAMGYTYGTTAMSQQSLMLAAQEAGLGTATTGGLAASLGWAAAPLIVGAILDEYGYGKVSQTGIGLRGSFGSSGFSGDFGAGWNNSGGWFEDKKDWNEWLPATSDRDTILKALIGSRDPSTVATMVDNQYVKLSDLTDLSQIASGGLFDYRPGTPISIGDNEATDFTDWVQMTGLSGRMGADVGALYTTDQNFLGNIDKAMDELYTKTKEGFVKLTESLGDSGAAEALANFSKSVYVEQSADLKTMMTSVSTQLAEGMGKTIFPVIDKIREASGTTEKWIETFNRVSAETVALTTAFKNLGLSLGSGTANDVMTVSNAIVNLLGGFDSAKSAIDSYYTAFYSEEEKIAKQTEVLGKAFEELNIAMPSSRNQFRNIVDGLDLTTEAGQTLFAELMKLSPAFASITEAVDESVSEILGLVDEIRGDTAGKSLAQVQSEFDRTTAAARSGDVNAMNRLPDAARALLEVASERTASSVELNRIKMRTANSLEMTAGLPSFDVGTNYVPYDMVAKIHEGEAIIPKAYNPSATLNSANTEYLLQAILSRVEAISYETQAVASHTNAIKRLSERTIPDGDAVQVRVIT